MPMGCERTSNFVQSESHTTKKGRQLIADFKDIRVFGVKVQGPNGLAGDGMRPFYVVFTRSMSSV
jgi:hypothetical protein